MPKNGQIIDDIARVAGGAMNIIGGVKQHVREDVKARVEDIATDIDLVPREDFERVEALLMKSLEEQKQLTQRIEALEKALKLKKKK